MRLTHENPDYLDPLHRLLARDKQILQRLWRVKRAILHMYVFEGHRKQRVQKRSDQGGCEFDVRQRQLSPEPWSGYGARGGCRGFSNRKADEAKVVQFRKQANEEEERLWVHRRTSDSQRIQFFREVTEDKSERSLVERGEVDSEQGKGLDVTEGDQYREIDWGDPLVLVFLREFQRANVMTGAP